MDGEREQTGRPTPPFLYALVLMAGAGGAIAILGTFFEVLHCTDGDGGAPYVAVDSPAKNVCNATGDGFAILPASVLLIGIAALLARRLHRARPKGQRGRGRWALIVALMAAMPLAPLLLLALHNAPSSQCSDAVARAGGDCEHY